MLLRYVIRRLIWTIPFLFAVSIVVFALIQAPPGDFMTTYVAKLAESNESVDQARVEFLRERYGLNEPFYVQYWKWVSRLAVGGQELVDLRPVAGSVVLEDVGRACV